jgi:uncharacterized FAD-dependent dehydrogenase
MEKIVIIGAGVAGVNAATKLVDNGYPGDHITIIDMGNDPYKRKPEEVMTGFMGAGGWSDGKLTYHTAIGGHMSKYCGEEKAMELMDEVITNFKRFHPKPEEVQCSNPEAEPDFIKPYFGLRLFPVWHVGTDYLHEIGKNWYNFLCDKGVKFHWNKKVTEIDFANNKAISKYDGGILSLPYDRLIFAVGKSGIDFGKHLIEENNCATEPKPVQIGVRFEAPQKHFQKLIDVSYDFKLYRKFEDKGVSLRSFCTNNNAAYVALEETYGDYSYNGHAKKDEAYRNDMTNFGILMEVQGIDKPFDWSRELVSKVQRHDIVDGEGGGGKKAQGRHQSKYKAGLYYSPSRIKTKTSEGDWVKAHYIDENGLQQVRDAFQGYFTYIEDFIEDMKKVFPSLGDDWGMYIPEVKYLSPEPLVNYDDLSLNSVSNVHFVGDALSARGITVSGAQGTYVAENIIDYNRDELFFHLEDANYIGGLTMPKENGQRQQMA